MEEAPLSGVGDGAENRESPGGILRIDQDRRVGPRARHGEATLALGGAVRGDPGAPEESVVRQRREHARRGGILRGDGDDAVAHDERDVVVRVHGAGRHVELGRHELGSHREVRPYGNRREGQDSEDHRAHGCGGREARRYRGNESRGVGGARAGRCQGGFPIVDVDFSRTT